MSDVSGGVVCRPPRPRGQGCALPGATDAGLTQGGMLNRCLAGDGAQRLAVWCQAQRVVKIAFLGWADGEGCVCVVALRGFWWCGRGVLLFALAAGACRHLVGDRMGVTGARWSLAGAQSVLWMRAIAASGDTRPCACLSVSREYSAGQVAHMPPWVSACRTGPRCFR